MAEKFIYIVSHYVPFPISDGGIWNVIAKDDDECFDLITAEDDGGLNEKHYSHLRENIINAIVLPLANDEESRIVEQFTI